MNRKQIIQRIGHLEDQHKEKMIDGEYCRGCEICEEITKLSVHIKHSPNVAEILEKGEDMTKSEIKYLIDKQVDFEVIANALKTDVESFRELWKKWQGSEIKQRKVRTPVTITIDEYLKLSGSGLMDKEIAEKIGVSRQTITNWKIKHKNELPREDVEKVELTKENYIGWKKQGLKDIEITKLIKKNTNYLKDWKKENLTREEIRTLNLPRGHFAKKTNKSLQKENKPQKTKSETIQTDAEKELQEVLARKYLDTLEKYKETDYQLQNALQKIKEVESERDQYKLNYEKVSEYANKARAFIKVAL
ncbi:response regulator transcription factor [Bacillus sp. Gen3]|nr:response regulator transcription factor [Bacillus sp. Gen3]